MKLTQIEFSPWFPWKGRIKIDNIDSPGIFILAKFKRVPKCNANPNSKIYSGPMCLGWPVLTPFCHDRFKLEPVV